MRSTRIRTALFLVFAIAVLMGIAPKSQDGYSIEAAVVPDVSSIKSGDWSDPTVWDKGTVPRQGNNVTINFGHAVIYDVPSDVVLGTVSVEGTLYFSRTADTRLKTNDNIMVMSSGYLNMGTPSDPIPKHVKVEVIFVLPQGYSFTGGSDMDLKDKGIWAMGRWDAHGAPLMRAWTKLAADAPAGATTLTADANTSDWYIGGNVVVTQTSNPYLAIQNGCNYKEACNYVWENEVRTITALQILPGGGTQITLDSPLAFAHQGTGATRGEIGLLTRNVLIRTEIPGVSDATLDEWLPERRFAHTMFMGSGKGTVQYIELKYMGHLGTLARYPIHLHMIGTAANGMIIRGNSIWRSGNRGFQAHNSQGALFEDNVAFDTTMSSYYVERIPTSTPKDDPTLAPNDIAFIHNLGVMSSLAPSNSLAPAPGTPDQNDDTLFWFDQLDVTFLGNVGVASGAGGGAPGGSKGGPLMNSLTQSGIYISENSDNTGVIQTPVFVKNEFHSNSAHGWRFWQKFGSQELRHDFVDVSSWRNGQDGVHWGYYRTVHRLYQLQSIENKHAGVGSFGQVTSGTKFIQDAEIIGNPAGIKSNDEVARAEFPDDPYMFTRVNFQGNNIDLERRGSSCSGTTKSGDTEDQARSFAIASRGCSGNYAVLIKPTFSGSGDAIQLGGQGNKNTFWRFVNAAGLDPALPNDFLLMKPEIESLSSETPFNAPFRNGTMIPRNDMQGVVIPTDSLPVQFTVPTSGRYDFQTQFPILQGDYTFDRAIDEPPEVSIDVAINGTMATVTAFPTDDVGVTKVDFYMDEELVATKTAGPYEVTVDLTGHGRKYAYLYAVAWDGQVTSHTVTQGTGLGTTTYAHRSYSRAEEVGPEVILGNQPSPPVVNQAPLTDAGYHQSVAMASPAMVTLNGSVIDDNLPNPPASVTTQWSQVSGPAAVSFTDPNSQITTASFTQEGVYTLRLFADDSSLTAADETTVSVLSPPALFAISVAPSSASIQPGGAIQFTASGQDQYGEFFPISPTWNVSGGGSIDQSGLFTAGTVEGGPFTVTASDGSVSGTGAVSVVTQLVVSDLTVASGKAYELVNGLSVGQPVYIDRGYTYSNVPAILQGETHLRTANNDKSQTNSSFLSFTVNRDVTVYVAYDSRANSLPSWLSGWSSTGQILQTTDAPLDLYSQEFNAGTITLGGNMTSPAAGAGSNYTVIILGLVGNPPNQAPLVSAGTGSTITVAESAVLNGTVSDDGLPNPPGVVTSAWSKVSGPGTVTFDNAGSPSTLASFSVDGIYTLGLVGDDSLLTTTSEVTVTVNQVNQAPVANAGLDISIAQTDSANLKGVVTDDGLPNPPGAVTSLWSKVSGPGIVTFTDASLPVTVASFSDAGVYVLSLVADDSALTSTSQVTVTVDQVNQAPVANAGIGMSITLPDSANLNGVVTDDGLPNPPGAVTSLWSQVSGPGTVTFADASLPVTVASFSDAGIYILSLVADDSLLTTASEVTVTVNPMPLNQAPVVSAGTGSTITVAESAVLNGTVSDDGLPNPPGVVTSAWSKVSGPGTVTFDNAGSPNTLASFSIDGIYTLGLVADDTLLTTTSEVTVTVNPAPSGPLSVSNLTVASGEAYQVVNGLAAGDTVYIDRGYTYTSVPAIIQGVTHIRTANNDKNRTETSFFTFSVDRDVTVYVAYDSRASSLPGWLTGWTNADEALLNTDVPLFLYSKDFAAGSITLGGNMASGAAGAGSSYSAAIVPR